MTNNEPSQRDIGLVLDLGAPEMCTNKVTAFREETERLERQRVMAEVDRVLFTYLTVAMADDLRGKILARIG